MKYDVYLWWWSLTEGLLTICGNEVWGTSIQQKINPNVHWISMNCVSTEVVLDIGVLGWKQFILLKQGMVRRRVTERCVCIYRITRRVIERCVCVCVHIPETLHILLLCCTACSSLVSRIYHLFLLLVNGHKWPVHSSETILLSLSLTHTHTPVSYTHLTLPTIDDV